MVHGDACHLAVRKPRKEARKASFDFRPLLPRHRDKAAGHFTGEKDL